MEYYILGPMYNNPASKTTPYATRPKEIIKLNLYL